jgi:hypothetical protein
MLVELVEISSFHHYENAELGASEHDLDAIFLVDRWERLGGDDRNRTGDKGFAGPCLTAWPRRHEPFRTLPE